jgi:hypothetical protein
MGATRNANKILDGKPEGKKLLRIYRHKLNYNIKMCIK